MTAKVSVPRGLMLAARSEADAPGKAIPQSSSQFGAQVTQRPDSTVRSGGVPGKRLKNA